MNEDRSVSAEVDLKLNRFFSNGPKLWMNIRARRPDGIVSKA